MTHPNATNNDPGAMSSFDVQEPFFLVGTAGTERQMLKRWPRVASVVEPGAMFFRRGLVGVRYGVSVRESQMQNAAKLTA